MPVYPGAPKCVPEPLIVTSDTGVTPYAPSCIGAGITETITTDRLWPVLVARIDTAAATGMDPGQLAADAAGMLAPALDTLRPHQYATGLLLHVSTLADPEPFQPGREIDLDIPPDPADQDLL